MGLAFRYQPFARRRRDLTPNAGEGQVAIVHSPDPVYGPPLLMASHCKLPCSR